MRRICIAIGIACWLGVPAQAADLVEAERPVVRRGADFETVTARVHPITGRPIFAPAVRPILTGPELTRDTADGCCKIHWTTTGVDAFDDDESARDSDANGLPDAVDAIEAGLVGGRRAYATELGWPEAPPDAGTGGDDRLDVYVRKIDGRGFAHVRDVDPGRVDMFVELNPKSWPREVLTSIATHELHHTMQFAVARNLDTWVYEATAAWAQYRFITSPVLVLARDVLWAFRLKNPERALTVAEGQLHYAAFVWWKFLLDALAAPGAPADDGLVLRAWREMATARTVRGGLDAVLASTRFGATPAAFAEFAEWQWFACAESDGRHYRPDNLACASRGPLGERALTTQVSVFPVAVGRVERIESLAAGYVELVPDCRSGDLHLTLTPDATTSPDAWSVRLLEVPPAGEPVVVRAQALPAGVPTSFDVTGWNTRRRVVAAVSHLDDVAASGFGFSASVSGTYAPPGAVRPVVSVAIGVPALELARVGDAARPPVTVGYGGTCEDGAPAVGVTWKIADPAVLEATPAGELVALARGETLLRAVVSGVESDEILVRVLADAEPDGCDCRIGTAAGRSSRALGALLVLGALALAGFGVRRLRRGAGRGR